MPDWCYELSSVSTEWIAQECAVSPRTAYRWRVAGLPALAEKWLRTRSSGLLDALRPAWHGWRLYDDALVAPDGLRYTQQRLTELANVEAEMRAQRIEVTRLRYLAAAARENDMEASFWLESLLAPEQQPQDEATRKQPPAGIAVPAGGDGDDLKAVGIDFDHDRRRRLAFTTLPPLVSR